MATCFSCGKEFPYGFRVYRNTHCPVCDADAKVCLNCRFYSPGAHWDCSETVDDEVKDKDRANFCDFFVLGRDGGPDSRETEKKNSARDAFKGLFGDE